MVKECFECGKDATEDHHVIPESLGGKKTIPLCGGCHALVHGGYNTRRDDHVELTKLGLQRAKERGVKLGNPNIEEARSLASDSVKRKADDFALSVKDVVIDAVRRGGSYAKAAEILNEENVGTARGGDWSSVLVHRIIVRLGITRDEI